MNNAADIHMEVSESLFPCLLGGIYTYEWNCWIICNSVFSFLGTDLLCPTAAALLYIPTHNV